MPEEERPSSWDVDQLSATGRRFMRSPESRSGILQELQQRLRREQQRRERQQQLLRSDNNADDAGGLARDLPASYAAPTPAAPTTTTDTIVGTEDKPVAAKTSPPPAPPPPPPPPPPLARKPTVSRIDTSRQPSGGSSSLRKTDENGTVSRPQSAIGQRPSLTSQVFKEIVKHHRVRQLATREDTTTQPSSYVYVPSTTKSHRQGSTTDATERRLGDTDSLSRLQQQQSQRKTPSNTAIGRSTPRLSSYDILLKARASQRSRQSVTPDASLEPAQADSSTRRTSLRLAQTPTEEIGAESNAASSNPFSLGYDSRASVRSSSFEVGQPPAPPPPSPRLSPTPPCLQCLMRCLYDSGLLGNCWVASVLELEEAFAIKAVADAAVSLHTGEPTSKNQQQQQQQILQSSNRSFSPNYYGSGGFSGDPVAAAQKPQDATMSKWQALERLCNFRDSLKTCSHVTLED